MTPENKKENIQDELVRADQAAREADLLFANGYTVGAVSRLYYWLFHTVRGLLLVEGLQPRSHEGALRLFSLHFVKTGLFAADDGHIFARLMKYRQEADYNASYVFGQSDYPEFKKDADKLCSKIHRYLAQKGYA